MYNLGMEGDDALIEQHNISQQMMGTSSMMMDDDIEPSPRGEEHTPFLTLLTGRLLRTSLTLKAIAMALMCLFFLGFGGRWVFTFHSHPDMANGFHLTMVILMLIYTSGTIGLAIFQAFVADDSKWTKGFRTGSKILSAAVTLDMLSAMLRLVQYVYLYQYLSVLWWSKFNITKSEWTLFTVSNVIDGLSLISYGWAFFYMEVYHDEGTFEELAWTMNFLFSLSGIFMILMVFSGFGAVFMLLSVVGAYITACYWSFLFEPLLEKWSPQLHSRDINTDIIPQQNDGNYNAVYDQQKDTSFSHQSSYHPQMMSQSSSLQPGEIPTHYDYSQIQHQISQGVEMGVVSPQY